MIKTIMSNIDREKLERMLGDRSAGKSGLAIAAISEAISKSNVRMLGSRYYYYNGQIYAPLNKLESIVANVLMGIDPSGDLISKHGSITSGVGKILAARELNIDNNLLGFKNCVLDLTTAQTYAFSPEFHIVSQLEYNYDAGAKPKLWNKFLSEVLPDDGSIELLQDFLGAIFLDRRKVKFEHMMFLLGDGSNGKSVVFDTVLGVLGSENVSNHEITALTNGSSREKNLVDINGKLLNYCSEVSSRSFSSTTFKALVSGEPQQGRPVYGMPIKVENIPLMMANANTMPSFKDASSGVLRRIIILPFSRRIAEEKQDRELSSKMRVEYPAIMNWILEGRRRISENGYKLNVSPSAISALDLYRSDNNSVYDFIEANEYNADGGGEPEKILAGVLYASYVEYCEASGLDIESLTIFGRTMTGVGFKKSRAAKGNTYNIYMR